MAGLHITSGTTVANTVSEITFATWYRGIEVENRSSGDMWVRFDSVNPTIAGDDCFFVPSNGSLAVTNPQRAPEPAIGAVTNTDVRIITAAAANFTVQAGV